MKRYSRAILDHFAPVKQSYAQHGEDVEIASLLKGLDLSTGIYIDVGANQPSLSSNTYLFYRQGLSGLLIEPDASNFTLLKRFRPRDIALRVAIGLEAKLCKFNYALFSVNNSIQSIPASDLIKEEYMAQITLDQVLDFFDPYWVYILSTDTEGNDLDVLRGGSLLLRRTLLVCVEYHGRKERRQLEDYMKTQGFYPVSSNRLNIIFQNTEFLKTLRGTDRAHGIPDHVSK